MSLTKLLREPDVRQRFNAEFVKPKIVLARSDSFVPPSPTKRAALIGTAFDYLARLHVESVNQSVSSRPWIAEEAVERLEVALASSRPVFVPDVKRSTRGLLKQARGIAITARCEFESCVKSGVVSKSVIRSSLLLAQLDAYYRCGILGRDFGKTDEADVTNLDSLTDLLRGPPARNFVASRVCVLNPGFGEASALVHGADADLLIDDTLIELKTTKELEFSADTFRQLMGYYVLSKIGRIADGFRPKPVIRNIALYSSRYGVFHKISVGSVINAKTLPEFVRWFAKRAQYGPTCRPQIMHCADGVTVVF